MQAVLRCLCRSGLKIGGKMSESKPILADRLAYWLNQVIEAGREVGKSSVTDEEHSSDAETRKDGAPKQPILLNPASTQVGEIPHDAQVTAEQAESALCHNQSTELDGDSFELLDLDQREEEEALQGRYVNPEYMSGTTRIDYECLCWSPEELAPDSVSAKTVGWMPVLTLRMLSKSDFACTMEGIQAKLHAGIDKLYTGFQDQLSAAGSGGELARRVDTLDPTQLVVYRRIAEWAASRLAWVGRSKPPAKSRIAYEPPPTLRLLLLDTAGTGKTHTAQIAVAHVRRALGSFRSVLTVAFSGVAAVNLGGGARTVDSIFHTNSDNAAEDLRGEGLDKHVEELRETRFLPLGQLPFKSSAVALSKSGRCCGERGIEHARLKILGGSGGSVSS